MHQPLPFWRLQAIAVVNPLLDCENKRFSHNEKNLTYTAKVVICRPPTLQNLNLGYPRYWKQNRNNNNNRQKLIMMVKMNLKATEIIDCTCTVASISSISRFAYANVWSVCVVTSSIYMTFVGVCFAFVNIFQKKKKKEKRMYEKK